MHVGLLACWPPSQFIGHSVVRVLAPVLQVGLPVFMWVGRFEEEDEVLGKELENEWGDHHETTNGFLLAIH
jgi:hypothetical protein